MLFGCYSNVWQSQCGIYQIFLSLRFYVKSKICESRVSNSAILHFLNAEILKIKSPKNGKNWQLELLNSPNCFHIKSERQKNQENSSLTNRSNFYSKVAKVEKPQFCQHCSSFCAHARFLNINKCLSARFLNINKSVYLGRLSVL